MNGYVTISADGGYLILPPTAAEFPLPNVVWYYSSFIIKWEYVHYQAGQSTWVPAGASWNEMYVTLAVPGISPVYHTLIHLSVPISAEVAAADDATVIAQTWKNFETRDVKTHSMWWTLSGRPLTYYKEWDTASGNAVQLLTTLDGQCGGFVDGFIMSLKIIGVPAAMISSFQVASPIDGMLINNWKFTDPGTANVVAPNGKTYPYQNTLADPTKNPDSALYPGGVGCFTRKNANNVWEYYWGATVEVADMAGLRGQNTDNPKSHFSDHWLVKVAGKYYDPSYGNKFDSLQAWEDGSVAGFVTIGTLPGNNFRLLFRKNHAGLDVVTDPLNS